MQYNPALIREYRLALIQCLIQPLRITATALGHFGLATAALHKLPIKILVLNKVDKVKPAQLLPLASAFQAVIDFERTFMVSALTGDGLTEFMTFLEKSLPEGPWAYPEDQLSDLPSRLRSCARS